jgi:hypothetical protein
MFPWYDSRWLSEQARAIAILRAVRPDALAAFLDALRVFHTPLDFRVTLVERAFDDETMQAIRQAVASLTPGDLELHEAKTFGRFVVHDHPFFTALQYRIVPLVSQAVGEPVEVSYNFLGLYGHRGVCAPHVDAPSAKWTLDLCIDQSLPWPIHFSQPLPWPELEGPRPDDRWEQDVKESPSLHFTTHALQPGQSVVFSGSSQWHYRDPMPPAPGRSFCDMLFFHFIPRGTSELVKPQNWARLFGIPELELAEPWV